MPFTDNVNETAEYEYDQNGNMTKDLNANITRIQYNCLYMPKKQISTSNKMAINYII